MSSCPYCFGGDFSVATVTRSRPETFSTLQCASCDGYVLRHASGRVYPMDDRTDPDGDGVSRVID